MYFARRIIQTVTKHAQTEEIKMNTQNQEQDQQEQEQDQIQFFKEWRAREYAVAKFAADAAKARAWRVLRHCHQTTMQN